MQGKKIQESAVRRMRGHKLTPTCIALSPDDTTVYSGSKDNSVMRWDVETGKRVVMLPYWRKHPGGKVPEVKAHSNEVSVDSHFYTFVGSLFCIRVDPWIVAGQARADSCCKSLSCLVSDHVLMSTVRARLENARILKPPETLVLAQIWVQMYLRVYCRTWYIFHVCVSCPFGMMVSNYRRTQLGSSQSFLIAATCTYSFSRDE